MNPDLILEQHLDSLTRALAHAETMKQKAWLPHQHAALDRRIRILKAMLAAATREA